MNNLDQRELQTHEHATSYLRPSFFLDPTQIQKKSQVSLFKSQVIAKNKKKRKTNEDNSNEVKEIASTSIESKSCKRKMFNESR